MGTHGDGDILLTSAIDRLATPFNSQTDEDLTNDISLFEDFLLPSNAGSVGESDQLTLLMKDIDLNFDFLDQNDNSNLLHDGQKCVEDFVFPPAENCFSHYSPISTDSGNHSPSSTSSEGVQFGELWNNPKLKVGEETTGGELSQASKVIMDSKQENDLVLNLPSISLPEKNEMINDDCSSSVQCAVQPQVPSTVQKSNQSFVYIVPSTSSGFFNQQNICLNSMPVQKLVEKPLVCKRSSKFISSNRMQPYTKNRPQLLIPKSDSEAFSVNSLINTVSLATPATIITPVIASNLGVSTANSLNKFFLPVSSSALINSDSSGINASADAQEYARKREERKIKNRASAQQSRLRKRHELDALKQKLSETERTVEKLRKENEQLRKQISCLRSENDVLKKNFAGARGRTGVVTGFACFLFFCTFASFGQKPMTKLETFSEIHGTNPSKVSASLSAKNPFHGRPLLSVQYDDTKINTKKDRREKRFAGAVVDSSDGNEGEIRLFDRNISDVDCYNGNKLILNQTERIKVNNDLSSWVDRHERLLFLQMRSVFRAPVPKLSKTANDSVPFNYKVKSKLNKVYRAQKLHRNAITKKEGRLLKVARERPWQHMDLISTDGTTAPKPRNSGIGSMDHLFSRAHKHLPVDSIEKERLHFPNAEIHYMELARAIKQKNDTLYVVALQDYYLLPTVNRNSTDRPRVSLILPAFSYNGTVRNQVSMMRIECEVTGTDLFHISDSLLLFFYNQSYYHY